MGNSRLTVSILWFQDVRPFSRNRRKSRLIAFKSGIRTSIVQLGNQSPDMTNRLGKDEAPPSPSSSRLTDVITAWRKPSA